MTVPATIYSEVHYGIPLYGFLGLTPAPSYLVEPFVAQSLNYTSIGVSWAQPTGAASRWRLLTNRYGYPVDQNDGEIVLDDTDYPGNFYLDTNVIPGSYHYYGIYALTNAGEDLWQRCGVTACLAVGNYGTAEFLKANLPPYFTENLGGELTQDATANPYLFQFLEVLGWGIDYVKTQYGVLANHLNDPLNIPIGDLVNLCTEVGLEFDPMVSTYLMRKAAANWAHVNQEGGTLPGILGEIELATGFDVDLQVGPNLMLEQDQSVFTDPVYPPWNASIGYNASERVSYGNFLYSSIAGSNVGNAPSGTSSNNSFWNAIVDGHITTVLANPVTGGQNTWEVIYPAASHGIPSANSIREGIGVPDPGALSHFNVNSLQVVNQTGGPITVAARSVSRTTTDAGLTSSLWIPDPSQAINDGVPVPFTRPSQEWDATVRYGTDDIVTYNGLPFIALRASTGATPPVNLTPTPEWSALSHSARLPLMVSASTSQSLATGTDFSAAVTPFVDWYDSWGNFIVRNFARTPSAPGIPDNLAYDSFTANPGPSISGRTFDNAYAHNWVAEVSDFKVTGYAGGVAYPVTAGTAAMALTTAPADGQVGVTYKTATTGGQEQGVVFRFSNTSNYWKATTTHLFKRVAGTNTTVATYATPAAPGDRMVVQMNGTAITVLINGASAATATDAFNDTATLHGMGVA